MNKVWVLALAVLFSAMSCQAYPSQKEGNAASSPTATTIEGCVQYESGQYTLIDHDGTPHRLAGAGKQLKPQVGHEVELTGKPSSRSLVDTPPGGASTVIQQYVFEVKGVKQLANVCKTY